MARGATAAEVLEGKPGATWSAECGDALEWLRSLPADSVHACVTSPPYFGLRDYGVAGQIGLEDTPAAYVGRLTDVFREARRVLHPSGCLWLNLGDSFNNAGSSRNGEGLDGNRRGGATGADGELGYKKRDTRRAWNDIGIKHKDLLGIPWMTAFALRADGWYLRQWCPWVKRNPMPESIQDRPGSACECVFLLTKTARPFFDMEAVRKPASEASLARINQASFGEQTGGEKDYANGTNPNRSMRKTLENFAEDPGRNFRNGDLWFESVGLLLSGEDPDAADLELLGLDVTIKPYKGAHFAVMPKSLVEPLIAAGTSARGVCPRCAAPWVRQVKKTRKPTRPGIDTKCTDKGDGDTLTAETNGWNRPQVIGNRDPQRHCTLTETTGWRPSCDCGVGETVPAVVLDPFLGSGTVAAVAVDMGRRAVGCELNGKYLELVSRRMATVTPGLPVEGIG